MTIMMNDGGLGKAGEDVIQESADGHFNFNELVITLLKQKSVMTLLKQESLKV